MKASQRLLDEMYEALDRAQAEGIELQTMWGLVHHVGLDLEMQMLQSIRNQNIERAAALKAMASEGSDAASNSSLNSTKEK